MTEESLRLVRLLEAGEMLRRIEGKLDEIGSRRNEVERRLGELEQETRDLGEIRVKYENLKAQMDRRREWQETFWKRTFIILGAIITALGVLLGGMLWVVRYAPHGP